MGSLQPGAELDGEHLRPFEVKQAGEQAVRHRRRRPRNGARSVDRVRLAARPDRLDHDKRMGGPSEMKIRFICRA